MKTLSGRVLVHVVVLAGFVGLCWFYVGFAFGTRWPVSGDEWYLIANSVFDHFPACLGTSNWINPWRPLQPTITCVTIALFGPNLLALGVVGVLVTAMTAFAWYAVLRNLFNLPASFGFVAGVFLVAFPDTTTPLLFNIPIRLAGSAAILAGCWLVLTFWDDPGQPWRLVLGCVAALLGFLIFESLIGVWVVGLPLALLYKNRRWSRRWLGVSACILGLFAAYMIWRLLLLPGTYAPTTILSGAGAMAIRLDASAVLQQLGQVSVLPFRSLTYAFELVATWIADPDLGQMPLINLACACVASLTLYLLARLDQQSLAPSTVRRLRPQVFVAALLSVPIFSLPYLFIKLDILTTTYITYGAAFSFALALLAVVLAAKMPRAMIKWAAFVTVIMALFAALVTSIYALGMRRDSSCDFLRRFTDLVEKLPPDMYVVIKSETAFNPWSLSTMMGYAYYDGPTGADHYDLGRHGYHGYLFVQTNQVNITPQGIKVNWAEIADLQTVHPFTPLPDVIPPQQAVVVEYNAFQSLSVIWLPHQLGQETEESSAFAQTVQKRIEPFCPRQPQ